MKDLYLRFREWLKYVKNYKENKDNDLIYDHKLIEKQREIDKQKVETAEYKYLVAERQKLIQLQEKRIQNLNKKITFLKKNAKELDECLAYFEIKTNMLEEKLNEKEQARRKIAGSLGGYKAKISQLQKELEKANYTINFYKTHQKSPTLEELKAYEYSRKEVERRQKDGKTQNS